jgi:uncharacterized protein YbjT (DUF2867 family)
MSAVAVVGITGTIGGRVADRLVARGREVIGLARSPESRSDGIELRAADLTDRSAATQALRGAEAVYLTPPLAGDDALDLERAVTMNVIEAARELGLGHVVLHTAVHADRGTTGSRILDNKQPIEAALAASGVPYTILRPAWYLQNLFGAKAWLEQGMFSMPWSADMTWAATDVDDVARAAVAFFESGPANRGFDVHLPGGVTADAICGAVRRVTGRDVSYQEAPGTREAVDPYPLSDFHTELYAELFDYFKRVEYAGDPMPVTEAVDGFTYGTVESFVQRELFPSS